MEDVKVFLMMFFKFAGTGGYIDVADYSHIGAAHCGVDGPVDWLFPESGQ